MAADSTPDDLTLYLAAQRAFGERVHAVRDEQWRLGTPAVQWTVADLVRHVVDEQRWAVPLLEGFDLEAAAKVVDAAWARPVGADLVASWDEAAAESTNAFTADGALARQVELSRGPAPSAAYLRELIFDLVIHSWDLGSATDHAEPLPADLVDEMYLRLVRVGGDLSSSGLFDAPIPISEDAPTIYRLVALTGREPR